MIDLQITQAHGELLFIAFAYTNISDMFYRIYLTRCIVYAMENIVCNISVIQCRPEVNLWAMTWQGMVTYQTSGMTLLRGELMNAETINYA